MKYLAVLSQKVIHSLGILALLLSGACKKHDDRSIAPRPGSKNLSSDALGCKQAMQLALAGGSGLRPYSTAVLAAGLKDGLRGLNLSPQTQSQAASMAIATDPIQKRYAHESSDPLGWPQGVFPAWRLCPKDHSCDKTWQNDYAFNFPLPALKRGTYHLEWSICTGDAKLLVDVKNAVWRKCTNYGTCYCSAKLATGFIVSHKLKSGHSHSSRVSLRQKLHRQSVEYWRHAKTLLRHKSQSPLISHYLRNVVAQQPSDTANIALAFGSELNRAGRSISDHMEKRAQLGLTDSSEPLCPPLANEEQDAKDLETSVGLDPLGSDTDALTGEDEALMPERSPEESAESTEKEGIKPAAKGADRVVDISDTRAPTPKAPTLEHEKPSKALLFIGVPLIIASVASAWTSYQGLRKREFKWQDVIDTISAKLPEKGIKGSAGKIKPTELARLKNHFETARRDLESLLLALDTQKSGSDNISEEINEKFKALSKAKKKLLGYVKKDQLEAQVEQEEPVGDSRFEQNFSVFETQFTKLFPEKAPSNNPISTQQDDNVGETQKQNYKELRSSLGDLKGLENYELRPELGRKEALMGAAKSLLIFGAGFGALATYVGLENRAAGLAGLSGLGLVSDYEDAIYETASQLSFASEGK